jgi:hypothetical protein
MYIYANSIHHSVIYLSRYRFSKAIVSSGASACTQWPAPKRPKNERKHEIEE